MSAATSGESRDATDGFCFVTKYKVWLGKGSFMQNPFEDENGDYLILVNRELQYSLWPSFRETPAGWSAVGTRGSRKDCLAWINSNWTDMRPLSLVEQMDRDAKNKSHSSS
jgi:MbtH protein